MSELIPGTSKSFQGLEVDYAFFEQSIDECEQALRQWRPLLQNHAFPERVRVLDFGCGTGIFTLQVLELLNRAPEETEIYFVEPAASSFESARTLFEQMGFAKVEGVGSLDELTTTDFFDLIFSHHVLYYVPSPALAFQVLKQRAAENCLMLHVVGGEANGPGLLQNRALGQAGLTSPYHQGVDIRDCFLEIFPKGLVTPFQTHLRMADTRGNRASIMRFLIGEFGEKVSFEQALALFDPFAHDGEIVVPSEELSLSWESWGLG